MENNCKTCGKCCKVFTGSLYFGPEDIKRAKQRKPSVLEWLAFLDDDYADAFFNPLNGEELLRDCPFLRRGSAGYYCDIYDVRPSVCRGFPWGKENDICKVPLEKIRQEFRVEEEVQSEKADYVEEWKQRFKKEFAKLCGDYMSFCYESLAKDCFYKYGLATAPEAAARDQTSFYE